MLKKAAKQFSIVSLIIFGTIIWSITMVRSGLLYDFGLGFWGPNGHDGVWHVALAESLSKGALNIPIFAGEQVKNYHLGFDLLLALINRLTSIPISYLYFQILPPIFAFLIGYLTYEFIFLWRKSKDEAFWATMFVYFASGFGFVVTLLRDGVVTGESMFWSQQSISTLVNPPYALSLIFILAGLIFLQKKNLLLSILFFGLLIQIKAYAAILILGGLFVAAIYSFYIQHTTYYIRIFIGSLLLNLLLFLITKSDGIAVFAWQPFWFLETMMSYSDRVGWDKFYSAMTTYKMGHVWIKGVTAYVVAFIIFIIGNFGTRLVGLLYFWKLFNRKIKLDEKVVMFLTIMLSSILIPMFFIQSGTPWNTIQFLYYGLFISSIFAGISLSFLSKKFILIFIIFSIFGAWSTLQHYVPPKPQSMVSNIELEALSFLKNKKEGIVLTYPFDSNKAKAANFSPRPLYLYDSTSYVSAMTLKTVYMEDEVNLNIMGYDWKYRREDAFKFFSTSDIEFGKKFLDIYSIKYLYLVRSASPIQGELFKLPSDELGLEKIFENKEYIIYEYGKDFGNN